jgi:DNA-binding MarR family transcriptional regulator
MEERFQAFTVLITGISRSIHRIKTEEMSEFELRSSHVSCLYYLYKKGSLTAREICDLCEEDKANISRAVKFLEEKGYVSCESEEKKRYQSPLSLTDSGKEIGKAIVEKIDRVLDVASRGLTDEERAVMYKGLAVVNKNLNELCESFADREV